MPVHFGHRVVGKDQYDKDVKAAESGEEHFGPRVLGDGTNKPYAESAHGAKVVGEAEAELAQATIRVAGKPTALEDMKPGHLEKILDDLGERYKDRTPKIHLIRKIRAALKLRGIPEPGAEPAGLTATEELAPDEPTIDEEMSPEDKEFMDSIHAEVDGAGEMVITGDDVGELPKEITDVLDLVDEEEKPEEG